ncbi:MAG: SpoIIE family protein phosphatase [Spirochaetia bacterium]
MARKVVFYAVLLFISLFAYGENVPQIEIEAYSDPVRFAYEPVVLIEPGDSAEYRLPEYDDSLWQVISVPSKWEEAALPGHQGITWYRIHIQFPDELPGEAIGISLGEIFDADQTFFNGELIGATGDVDNPQGNAFERDRIYQIPTRLIRPGDENVLAIRVRGIFGQSGLIKGDYIIAYYSELIKDFYLQEFLRLMFGVVYIVIAAYFLLFYIRRTQEVENLLFGIFSLCLSIYVFFRTELRYLVFENFDLIKRLEISCLFLLIPVLMAFILAYYRKKQEPVFLAYYAVNAVVILFNLFFIQDAEIRFTLVKIVQITWIFPVVVVLWTLVTHVKKSKDAKLMLYAITVLVIILVLDILAARNLIQLPSLMSYGFLLFVVSMAIILANRFVELHHEVEELNVHLEDKVKIRTKELNDALTKIQLRDKQLMFEMRMAGEIQVSLLPKPIPRWNGVHSAAKYQPLRSVSGDFFDAYIMPGNKFGVVIADVSGHGMPAALITIMAKRFFTIASGKFSRISEIFRFVNTELCQILQTEHYMTAFMIIFNGDGTIQYGNAGHTRSIMVNKEKGSIKLLNTGGTFIGAMEEANDSYEDKSMAMKKGDKLLLYTDCLTEAANPAGEMYEDYRLIESVKKHFDKEVNSFVNSIYKELLQFTDEKPFVDDLTIIGLEQKD